MNNNQIKNQINHINELKFKDIFLNDCKYTDIIDKNFKVLYKKIDNLYLVLFGVDVVNINKNNYLPYIYYLDKNYVKFKQIKKNFFGSGFNLENKTFEEISKIKLGNDSYTTLLLNSLKSTNTTNNTLKQKLENLKQKLQNKILPQLPQQEQFPPKEEKSQFPQNQKKQLNQLQQQEEQLIEIQQQIQEKTPQMLSQLKINELKERLQRIKSNKSNNLIQEKAKLESNILNELEKIKTNPENKNIKKQIKDLQIENLQELQKQLKDLEIKNLQELQNPLNFLTNSKKPDNFQDYICEDPSIEVKFESIDEIFFVPFVEFSELQFENAIIIIKKNEISWS